MQYHLIELNKAKSNFIEWEGNMFTFRQIRYGIIFLLLVFNSIYPVSAANETIIVATNRFVVLDDPISTGKTAQTTANFALPAFTNWGSNGWSGNQTTITGYALLIDNNGFPIKNTPVKFTVSNWNNASFFSLGPFNTNSNGIATFTLDMNNKNYYGNWKVNASALGKNDSAGFIYNWWGCHASGCQEHGGDGPGSANPSQQNSPYTLGREDILRSHHPKNDSNCVGCHRSYSGAGGGNTFGGQSYKTSDVHQTDTCSTCHAGANTHTTDEPIKSCTDCHPWANLSKGYTLGGSPLRSNYSGMTAATGHNPNNTIPCIICHGPMHNITKPDESQRFIKNTVVENSQCWACHTKREVVHYGEDCVSCHSQDAHKVAAGGGPDCLSCHNNGQGALHKVDGAAINSGIHANLNSAAINGTGIPADNKKCWGCHQGDGKQPTGMGDKYKDPYGCLECHGNTSKPSQASGALNATQHYKNGTGIKAVVFAANDLYSCLFCHNKSEMKVSYTETDTLWNNVSLVSHYGKKRTYMQNASNETNCAYCHQNTSEFNDIFLKLANTQITHNNGKSCYLCHRTGGSLDGRIHDSSLAGGSGNDCIACHFPGDVNVSKFGRHANINTSDGIGNVTDADCWTCHYQKDMSRSNVYLCEDCHLNSTGGIVHVDPSLVENDLMHGGMTTCRGCHAPTSTGYHQLGTVGPLGLVENILRKMQ